MEFPRPTEKHARLEALVGAWSGTEKMHPSPMAPEGGTAHGVVRNEMRLDGFAVIQDYEQQGDGPGFKGHGVFHYDPGEDCYRLDWFDSFGSGLFRYQGNWEGERLVLRAHGPMGHSRASFEFEGERYRFFMDVSPDGENWMSFMEGEYTRD